MLFQFLMTFSISLTFCVGAQAAIVLQFSPDGSPPQFSALAGQEVEIPVFIGQSLPLALNEPDLTVDGLSTFGLTGSVDGALAEIIGISVAAPFIEFGPVQTFPSSSAEIVGIDLGLGATGSAIQLGSFTVRPLTNAGFTLTLTDDLPANDDFVTAAGISLDGLLFSDPGSPPQITVAAVPEPASFASLLFVGIASVAVRRRRRLPIPKRCGP